MSLPYLSTSEILDLFTEEIEYRSGQVGDTFDDGRQLFARATLPQFDDVRPQDQMQGGVALRANAEEICVCPYVFRQVCRNGAIMAHALEARRVVLADDVSPEEATRATREAVAACCAGAVFARSMQEIRYTASVDTDLALSTLTYLSHLSTTVAAHIFERYRGDGDSSRYGLMNAITSVARDRKDPEERWRLEELGGGVAAQITPRRPTGSHAIHFPRRDPVEIG